jgi:hypothetical protein
VCWSSSQTSLITSMDARFGSVLAGHDLFWVVAIACLAIVALWAAFARAPGSSIPAPAASAPNSEAGLANVDASLGGVVHVGDGLGEESPTELPRLAAAHERSDGAVLDDRLGGADAPIRRRHPVAGEASAAGPAEFAEDSPEAALDEVPPVDDLADEAEPGLPADAGWGGDEGTFQAGSVSKAMRRRRRLAAAEARTHYYQQQAERREHEADAAAVRAAGWRDRANEARSREQAERQRAASKLERAQRDWVNAVGVTRRVGWGEATGALRPQVSDPPSSLAEFRRLATTTPVSVSDTSTPGEVVGYLRSSHRASEEATRSALSSEDAERLASLAAHLRSLGGEPRTVTVSELSQGLGVSWKRVCFLLRHRELRSKHRIEGVLLPEGLSGVFRVVSIE